MKEEEDLESNSNSDQSEKVSSDDEANEYTSNHHEMKCGPMAAESSIVNKFLQVYLILYKF